MTSARLLISIAAFTLAFSAVPAHAQGTGMTIEAKPATEASSSAPPYVNGEVRAVDVANGVITLQHEDIPNLNMSAMTMPFAVADKKLLKDLKPGDKVRFQVDTVKGAIVVTTLERKP